MDDIYHYTTEAVQANDGSSKQPEQDDAIINAFNRFGFGQRWSSLVDTVLQQSEQVVNVARSDLQEFAQVLRDDTTQTVEKISKSVKPDAKGKKRATTEDNEEGIWGYIRQAQLPAALRLPDNIDLGKLREEMDQGTRFAEQYLQKFGAEVIQTVNKHVGLYDDDEEEPEGRQSTSSNRSKRIFASRKERLLAEMRTDPETFTVKVPSDSVDVEKRSDAIAQTLEEFPELREMMDQLVPVQVSYVLFWQRYFYHQQRIEHEDEKRQIIAEGAEDEDEFKWDSDDEDFNEETSNKNESTKGKEVASKKEPSEDKEIVSKNEVAPSKSTVVPQTADDAPKKEGEDKSKKPEKSADDDSDSDWE